MRYPEEQLFSQILVPGLEKWLEKEQKSFRCVAMNAGTDLELLYHEADIIQSAAQAKFCTHFDFPNRIVISIPLLPFAFFIEPQFSPLSNISLQAAIRHFQPLNPRT